MICAAAFQGRVACFDLGTGNLIWSRDISSAAGVAIDSRYVYVSDDKGAVHALDKASGASLWKQDKLFLRRLTAPFRCAIWSPWRCQGCRAFSESRRWFLRGAPADRWQRVRAPAAPGIHLVVHRQPAARAGDRDPMKPSIVLVGRPNVGKSTLFNRLTRTRDALVADLPGLTRDRHYGHGRLGSKPYLVIDTGGFEPLAKDGIMYQMARQTEQAIDEADVVVFVVDGRSGVTAPRQGNCQPLAQIRAFGPGRREQVRRHEPRDRRRRFPRTRSR
jgi:hypothetical protein